MKDNNYVEVTKTLQGLVIKHKTDLNKELQAKEILLKDALDKNPPIESKIREILKGLDLAITPKDKLEYLKKQTFPGTNASIIDKIFASLKETEQKNLMLNILEEETKHPDIFFAYRSITGEWQVLFDLYSKIVSLASINDIQAHRINLSNFGEIIDNFFQYIENVNRDSPDHSKEFGALGLTCAFSHIDSSPGESAFYFWSNAGSSSSFNPTDSDQSKKIIDPFLSFMKINNTTHESIFDEIIELMKESKKLYGNIFYQFFVSPKIINDISWLAIPFGRKVIYRGKNISVQEPQNILSALLRHPEDFLEWEYFDKIWGKSFVRLVNNIGPTSDPAEIWRNFQIRLYAGSEKFYDPHCVQTKIYYVKDFSKEKAFKVYNQKIDNLAKILLENYLEKTKDEEAGQNYFLLEKNQKFSQNPKKQGEHQDSSLRKLERFVYEGNELKK
ncbi:MAG: hypothetical protein ACTSXG_04480 [Alphaproteobacteria bacterium]